MHLHNGFGAADVTSHRQHHHQLFPPPSETFHLPTNFSMPAYSSTLPDLDSQQPFIQHQHLSLFSDNQQQLPQQQQQLSEMIVEPLASSKFRVGNGDGTGIGHQNGSVLPHSLIRHTGGDQKDITASPYRSPSPAQFWRGNSNGMLEQQFLKFQRIGTTEPNYQHQASEFEVQNGSAGEIYESSHFLNPNSNNVTDSALKCSKCGRDSNAEDEYEKKLERQLKIMAQSFENQILAHQERLYERFTAKIEELERKRNEREESRRAAEAEKAQAQALARAEEQAAAASREAVLVSYLEKITGGKIQLPASGAVQSAVGGGGRWPTEEVNDLVKVRSEMESRFLEPGSKKNSLWEEISAEMGKLGHQRDAKRCKEKWENIKKYYERKKKEEELEGGSVKKKRRRNKACGYLDKLNQLYFNNLKANGGGNNGDSSGSYSNNGDVDQSKDGCEREGDGDGDENQLLMEANGDHPSESKSEEKVSC